MLDLTNTTIGRVKTALGEGTLIEFDLQANKYLVRFSKKDYAKEIQGNFVFDLLSAEELEEVK